IETHHLMFDDAADMNQHLSQEFIASSAGTETSNKSVTSMVPVSQLGMPSEALQFPDTSATEENAVIPSNLQEAVKTSEHQMILAAIQTTESRMEAAAKLGISPRTLRYKLAKLKAENGSMAWAA
ncbi:MAG: helix-turn-helix domain-containing protein, partial [Burkholderiales bacterium]